MDAVVQHREPLGITSSFSEDMMEESEDTNITTTDFHDDVEKFGYLMKKTSKGLWVNRYFETSGRYINYWKDITERSTCPNNPNETYDIADISELSKTNTRIFVLKFLKNNKFKLEVKCETDGDSNEWVQILTAKMKLYSFDELLSDLRGNRISFRTKTFQSLMVLPEKDQNKWMLDRLDEAFDLAGGSEESALQLRSNPVNLLKAAKHAVEEFLSTCRDCNEEVRSRAPKIVVHSRNYMKRYLDVLKGRLLLELLYLPGVSEKNYEALGERALACGLELCQSIDGLYAFSFIPKDTVGTINASLFSAGDLISSLLNLSIQRVDAFFDGLFALPTSQQAARLGDVLQLLSELFLPIKEGIEDTKVLVSIFQKVVTTELLTFSDQLTSLEVEHYNESELFAHIEACDQIHQTLLDVYLDTTSKDLFLLDATTLGENPTAHRQLQQEENIIKIVPGAVLDAMKSACNASALKAVTRTIQALKQNKIHLLKNFLNEQAEGWIGGLLCGALINNIDQWLTYITSNLPPRYSHLVIKETGKAIILIYIENMIHRYQNEKKVPIELSSLGVRQLGHDLQLIEEWIERQEIQEEGYDQEQTSMEIVLLEILKNFLISNESNALQIFSKAILDLGIQYHPHLYDLFRLLLKFRADISPKARKTLLGLCHEFTQQLELAVANDPSILDCPFRSRETVNIIDQLLPNILITHCTGSKWKTEHVSDPLAVQMSVSLLVTDTCNMAMLRSRNKQGMSLARQNLHSSRTSLMIRSRSNRNEYGNHDKNDNTIGWRKTANPGDSPNSPYSAAMDEQSSISPSSPSTVNPLANIHRRSILSSVQRRDSKQQDQPDQKEDPIMIDQAAIEEEAYTSTVSKTNNPYLSYHRDSSFGMPTRDDFSLRLSEQDLPTPTTTVKKRPLKPLPPNKKKPSDEAEKQVIENKEQDYSSIAIMVPQLQLETTSHIGTEEFSGEHSNVIEEINSSMNTVDFEICQSNISNSKNNHDLEIEQQTSKDIHAPSSEAIKSTMETENLNHSASTISTIEKSEEVTRMVPANGENREVSATDSKVKESKSEMIVSCKPPPKPARRKPPQNQLQGTTTMKVDPVKDDQEIVNQEQQLGSKEQKKEQEQEQGQEEKKALSLLLQKAKEKVAALS